MYLATCEGMSNEAATSWSAGRGDWSL